MSQKISQLRAEQVEVEIEILDGILSAVPRIQARHIMGALAYEKFYWRTGPKRKEKMSYTEHFFMHKGSKRFTFLTGHLRRVLNWCKGNNVKVRFVGETPSIRLPRRQEPHLDDITLRPDQIKLVTKAVIAKRGVIKSPTRTGKTVLEYAVISAYRPANALILAHTKDLVTQAVDEGKRFGFNVAVCYGEKKELNWTEMGQVVVMTRQTCINLIKKEKFWRSFFDIIIVDEGHHVSTAEGQYAQILLALDAPLRYAFTATLPDTVEGEMSLEGFIGPLIGELTIQEAIEQNLLVKPEIVLRKAPTVPVTPWTEYKKAYEKGIVENLARNRMIAQIAQEYVEQDHTVLILVTKIAHGYNIMTQLREIFVSAHFVHGETPSETRDRVKQGLIAKTTKCVVATTVWKEGINIPSLNVCINASGGKSEISTLQSVGRSLTKVEGKEHAVIVDFFDPGSRYLIAHFGERMELYFEQGWM
jgi:superfamily II DNA or RNA helicase